MPTPTNPELFGISDRVLRLEALASPALFFEEHFNTNTLLELKRFGWLAENYTGTIRTSGFEVQVNAGNVILTAGKCLFKEFILEYGATQTISAHDTGATRKVVVKVTTTRYTYEANPSEVGITIGSNTFSGPNQWRYSISFLYTTGAVPADTSTEFHFRLADVNSAGAVTMLVPLLSEEKAWTFLKLPDTPASYSGQGGKALRVNTGATALEFFDAAPLVHTHNDLYYTETEVDGFLAAKADLSHNHDDLYYTETEMNALLLNKSDVGHNHNTLYYQISQVDALLATKANTVHSHAMGDVTGLSAALNLKSDTTHTHTLGQLSDVPDTYTANKYLRVNGTGTALIFDDAITTFVALTDTPTNYTTPSTQTGKKYIRVNDTDNGITYDDPKIQFVTPDNVTTNNVYKVKFISSDSTVTLTHNVVSGNAAGASLEIDVKAVQNYTTWTDLDDTLDSYAGSRKRVVLINDNETGLVFGPRMAEPTSAPDGAVIVYKPFSDGTKGFQASSKIREIVLYAQMGIEVVGSSVINGDWVFNSSSQGPILKDSVTGISYRLKVSNGTLTLENISPGLVPQSANFANPSSQLSAV